MLGEDGRVPDHVESSWAYQYRDPGSGLWRLTCNRGTAVAVVCRAYTVRLVETSGGWVTKLLGRNAKKEREEDARHAGANEGEPLFGIAYPIQPKNGLGHAWWYRAPGNYRVTTPDHEKALREGGDSCRAIWVCYEGGKIDHVATQDEWNDELEARVGARVAGGLSDQQLDEFDAIGNTSEAKEWLERNCPYYDEVVRLTRVEMRRAAVL